MSCSSAVSAVAETRSRAIGAIATLLWALVSLGMALAEPPSSSAPPEVLLERMNHALRSLNYEGILVYLHQNHLETLSLDHRIRDGQIEERLIALSGPIRALARGKDRLNCVLTDGRPLSVERSGTGILDTEGIDPQALQPYYRIEYLGNSRIAGRETEVVGILPRDELRYGYRFHLDRETALPLKSDLIDHRQEPLEQLMFAAITLHPAEGETAAPATPPPSIRSAPLAAPSAEWRFDPRPPGFELVMQRRIEQQGVRVEHFLFTDRLSSYSVYIEPAGPNAFEGAANMSSVHAAGRRLEAYQITAVGEVPQATVDLAVAGVRRIVP